MIPEAAAAHSLACIDKLFRTRVSPENVAAIFVEPMLGEGGYVIPHPSFLQGLRALCDQHGILLVFDEVQTGVGRTGHMWAADHYGVEPDVLTTAKGLGSGMPIGAIIARESIMKWVSGSHGSTFGGNPVACAAALATLDVVEKQLLDNARTVGAHLLAGLSKLAEKYDCIGDIRGVGLYVGIELVEDRASRKPAKQLTHDMGQLAFKKGLLLLSCGDSVFRIAPPLVISEQQIDLGLAIMDECLAELTAG